MPTLGPSLARVRLGLAALATSFLALACGGGGGDAPPRSTFLLGTVGAGGALQVATTPFTAAGAVLRTLDDGTSVPLGSEAQARALLADGMVVAVRGETLAGAPSPRAAEILYRSVVRAPLAGRAGTQLAVGGAGVDLAADTVVLDAAGAPTTPEALAGGQVVEVSGWPDRGDRVRATLVRAVSGASGVTIHGWTRAAPQGGVFDLSLLPGGATVLRVDASGASGSTPIPANALVRVSGSTISAGTLTAASVLVLSQLLPFPEDRAAVEGVVTGGDATELQLGEHRVAVGPATAYDGVPAGGNASQALVPGVRLVAEGTSDGGRIVAERIRFVGLVRLAGRINPGSFVIGQPTTTAAWEVGPTNVFADAATRVSGTAGEPLTLAQLLSLHSLDLAGLPVVVHGYALRDGTIAAHRVDVTGG